jgi:hypothetical protein
VNGTISRTGLLGKLSGLCAAIAGAAAAAKAAAYPINFIAYSSHQDDDRKLICPGANQAVVFDYTPNRIRFWTRHRGFQYLQTKRADRLIQVLSEYPISAMDAIPVGAPSPRA